MNYKGAYDSGTSYSVGDVVVFTDGIAYQLFQPAAAGTTPHEKRVWRTVNQPLQEVVLMFHSTLSNVASSISALDTAVASIPTNISDDAITLTSGDDDYLITVDATGEEPELSVTKIEEEAES